MARHLIPLLFLATACANHEIATGTIELEDADGKVEKVSVSIENFHVNGFVDLSAGDGTRLATSLLQLQNGRFSSDTVVNTAGDREFQGSAELDANVTWIGERDFPVVYDARFVGGELRLKNSEETRKVVGGSLRIANKGCTQSGGLAASTDCGHGYHYRDEAGASVDVTLSEPWSKFGLTACPADLLSRWLESRQVVLTKSKLDLGKQTLPCITTQSSAIVCGATATGVEADGCKDWRVTIVGWPNDIANNADFSLVFTAGAECDGSPRTCRTEWASTEYVKRD